MASCKHCGAPLAANNNNCKYCGTRNDVDLHAKFQYQTTESASARLCPTCQVNLQTLRLTQDENIYIERCDQCFGLFFDRGEIEYILENGVSHVYAINLEHIDNINNDRYRKSKKIQYIKCPDCGVLMNRINFGRRSGVVVDQCLIHGIWLDSGELIHLLEWKKAGGQLLDKEDTLLKPPVKSRAALPDSVYRNKQPTLFEDSDDGISWGIVSVVISLILKLF